ncbi:MAG: hypothetical protein RR058_07400 [Oscillospiraceae bacterium]
MTEIANKEKLELLNLRNRVKAQRKEITVLLAEVEAYKKRSKSELSNMCNKAESERCQGLEKNSETSFLSSGMSKSEENIKSIREEFGALRE